MYSTRIKGTPRNRSVYATANNRKGKNTGPGIPRTTAMTSARTRIKTSETTKISIRDDERQDQDKDLRDHENLYVQQERSQHRGLALGADERAPQVKRAEEPLRHDPAPWGQRDDDRDDREKEHRARARHQH